MAVVGITPDDAVDNFAILAALAGKGAEMATERMGPAELAELERLADAIDGSDDVVGANRRFHRAVNHAARSPRLLVYLRQAIRVVPGNFFELFPEQEHRSKHEHAALLAAMARGRCVDGPTCRGGPRPHGRPGAGRLPGGAHATERDGRTRRRRLRQASRRGHSAGRDSRFIMRSRFARSSGEVNERSSAVKA